MLTKHSVPTEYHTMFSIGEIDRRGNIIDFKTPLVIVDTTIPISQHREVIFREHVPAERLPFSAVTAKNFLVLRPTALNYRTYVRKELTIAGLDIHEEFEINNFMKFADTLYFLDPKIPFHWKWRAVMRALHETGTQDQNRAVIFIIGGQDNSLLMTTKKNIRYSIGETPVLIRFEDKPEIALGIHHLHCPDPNRLNIEYNTLMHAKNKTSVFSEA